MALVYIGLGSNLGDGKKNLTAAWKRLRELPGIKPGRLSRPYITSPVGMESAQPFTNAVGAFEIEKACLVLLADLLRIEAELGRDRGKGPDRAVDLDILYYDDLIVKTPELTVPHPGIKDRLFVLAPLHELAPDLRNPVYGLTTQEMLAAFNDAGQKVEQSTWLSGEPPWD